MYLFKGLLFSTGSESSGETLNQELTVSYVGIKSKKFLIIKQGLIYNCNSVP
jgi:hypothetical protein